jgi:phage baseplate assembly protein W
MKITKSQLKQLIKEELESALNETMVTDAFRALVKLEPRRGVRPTERLINAIRDGGVPREEERAYSEVVRLFEEFISAYESENPNIPTIIPRD